jgi:hypothetical protein
VPVDVHARTLRHWELGRGWTVEAGDLVLSVGTSAGDLVASTTVSL